MLAVKLALLLAIVALLPAGKPREVWTTDAKPELVAVVLEDGEVMLARYRTCEDALRYSVGMEPDPDRDTFNGWRQVR